MQPLFGIQISQFPDKRELYGLMDALNVKLSSQARDLKDVFPPEMSAQPVDDLEIVVSEPSSDIFQFVIGKPLSSEQKQQVQASKKPVPDISDATLQPGSVGDKHIGTRTEGSGSGFLKLLKRLTVKKDDPSLLTQVLEMACSAQFPSVFSEGEAGQ